LIQKAVIFFHVTEYLSGSESVKVFLLLHVYINIAVRDPFSSWDSLTGLTPPHLCTCSKPGPRFPHRQMS